MFLISDHQKNYVDLILKRLQIDSTFCRPAAFIFVLPQKRSKKRKAAFGHYPALS